MAGATNDDLDLTALGTTLFGSNVTISLAKVKALLIVNSATTLGHDLEVGAAASAEWTAPFGAAGDKLKLPADSCLLLVNKKGGWSVTGGSADVLRVRNPGATPIVYKIVLIGTSA